MLNLRFCIALTLPASCPPPSPPPPFWCLLLLLQLERGSSTDDAVNVNSSFLNRVQIVGNAGSGNPRVQMLPLADAAAAAKLPALNAPEGLAVSTNRGTILVANTGADELLEVHCLAPCHDFTNASSAVVTGVTRLASLPRPRGMFTQSSSDTAKFSRVYVVGGADGEGYVAYYDFVDGRLHTVASGLSSPVGVFDDVHRPNGSGLVTPDSMDAEGSLAGLFVADSVENAVRRHRCSHVIDDFIESAL